MTCGGGKSMVHVVASDIVYDGWYKLEQRLLSSTRFTWCKPEVRRTTMVIVRGDGVRFRHGHSRPSRQQLCFRLWQHGQWRPWLSFQPDPVMRGRGRVSTAGGHGYRSSCCSERRARELAASRIAWRTLFRSPSHQKFSIGLMEDWRRTRLQLRN